MSGLLATLMARSIVETGVSKMAVHMFVLHFGMLSMITPPVALDARRSQGSRSRAGQASIDQKRVRGCLPIAIALLLGGCSSEWMEARERMERANIPPVSYRAEIVAFMRTYLNDPRGVRDAYVSEPALRTLENITVYSVCLRYDARKDGGQYAGSKDSLVLFSNGRLDRVVDNARGQCKDAAYEPFHELEAMAR